jgi:hypothetical protein
VSAFLCFLIPILLLSVFVFTPDPETGRRTKQSVRSSSGSHNENDSERRQESSYPATDIGR